MAVMYPQICTADTFPEKKIYQYLENDQTIKNWQVIHNFHKKNGDIDFIVLAPGYGIFVLEVKGGTKIEYRDNTWFIDDHPYDGRNNNREDPLKQVKRHWRDLRDILKKSDPKLNGILTSWIICLPNIKTQNLKVIPGITTSQIFGKQHEEMIGQFIKDLSLQLKQDYPKLILPTQVQISQILSLLSPHVKAQNTLQEITHDIKKDQDKTSNQTGELLLHNLLQKSSLVTGLASTGKTFIAIKLAREAIKNGEKVAFFCKNIYLSAWLKETLKDLGAQIVVDNWHGYLREQVPQNILPVGEGGEYYDEALPLAYFDLPHREKFTRLIIDEGQDLITPSSLHLEAMVSALSKDGKLNVFADPRQILYHDDEKNITAYFDLEDQLRKKYPTLFSFPLPNHNYRNAPKIIQEINSNVGTEIYKLPPNSQKGIVEYIAYTCASDQAKKIKKVVNFLKNDGKIPLEEMVILSPYNLEKSTLAEQLQAIGVFLTTDFSARKHKIFFSTIRKFKGLESSVVFLVDFDHSDPHLSEQIKIYEAMTRARTTLYICQRPNPAAT